VRRGFVLRLLRPARDLDAGNAALGAFLVRGLGAFLEALEQVVGVPVLRVVVLDVALFPSRT